MLAKMNGRMLEIFQILLFSLLLLKAVFLFGTIKPLHNVYSITHSSVKEALELQTVLPLMAMMIMFRNFLIWQRS